MSKPQQAHPLTQRDVLLQAAGEMSLILQGAAGVIGALVTALQMDGQDSPALPEGLDGKPGPSGEEGGTETAPSDPNGAQGAQTPGPPTPPASSAASLRAVLSRESAPIHLMGGQTITATP